MVKSDYYNKVQEQIIKTYKILLVDLMKKKYRQLH